MPNGFGFVPIDSSIIATDDLNTFRQQALSDIPLEKMLQGLLYNKSKTDTSDNHSVVYKEQQKPLLDTIYNDV